VTGAILSQPFIFNVDQPKNYIKIIVGSFVNITPDFSSLFVIIISKDRLD